MRRVVCVTGGRHLHPRATTWGCALDHLGFRFQPTELWHGDARGADRICAQWALRRGLVVQAFPAPWGLYDQLGLKHLAGQTRNRHMLSGWRGYHLVDGHVQAREKVEGRVEMLWALPGMHGTADCVRAAEDLGIEVVDLRAPERVWVLHDGQSWRPVWTRGDWVTGCDPELWKHVAGKTRAEVREKVKDEGWTIKAAKMAA